MTAAAAPAAAPAGAAPNRAAPDRAPLGGPVLVVGAGSVGRRHLRNLAALGVGAVALRTGRGQAGPLGGWPEAWSWDEALAHRPAAAVVANPTALHAEAAGTAALAGCHVLVEKPVAHTHTACAVLRAAAAAAGARVLVGYQLRFHPGLAAAREWIAAGLVGEVVAAHAHWGEYLPGWHPGEDYRAGYSARRDLGGGAVLTLSHPVDYLRWLLGEVEAVGAMTARRAGLGVDVEDVAALTLRHRSGALSTVTLDYAERPPRHTLHVTGAEGVVRWDAADGVARLRRAGDAAWLEAAPPPGFERNTLFLDEMRHFLDVAAGRAEPRCTLDDGARALGVALAAHEAAATGRVVRV